jgi:hypothetical protein
MAELVDKRRMGRIPAEFGPGLGRAGALIEEQDFGEVVAKALAGLLLGTGDRSWHADGDRGRLRQFGNGRVQPLPMT